MLATLTLVALTPLLTGMALILAAGTIGLLLKL